MNVYILHYFTIYLVKILGIPRSVMSPMTGTNLFLLQLSETTNSRSDCRSSGRGQCVRTSSDGFSAATAVPNTSGNTLDGILSTEGAGVLRMLSDFDLLHDLSQRGTISGSVLTDNTDLKQKE